MRHIFIELGLTESESAAYEALLKLGKQPASALLQESGLTRPNLYYALGQLKKRGLAIESSGKRAVFEAVSPRQLEELANAKVAKAEEAQSELRDVLPDLLSMYALSTDKPIVWFREGIDGLKEVYKDIAQSTKDLLVVPSKWDRTTPELNKLIDAQIRIQKEKGIQTRVIAEGSDTMTPEVIAGWKQHGMNIRLVQNHPFGLPSQLLIWENKIALTSFRKDLLTTVIQHDDVADTMKMMFEVLWLKTEIPSV